MQNFTTHHEKFFKYDTLTPFGSIVDATAVVDQSGELVPLEKCTDPKTGAIETNQRQKKFLFFVY
jgi:hypothetical protein